MAEVMAPATFPAGGRPWWKELNRYHWWVFAIASLSWLFDCMDQRFFITCREPAMRSLLRLPAGSGDAAVAFYGRIATATIMAGWAAGGLLFGILGDRIGRVRTMTITILVYSGFTGLSAISTHWWDFTFYRFLMGMGVGGLFASAVSLVAETMPTRARPHALGLLQALSALGNITGSFLSIQLKPDVEGWFRVENWRWLFLVGVLPALLVMMVQKTLKEPETWHRARSRASEDLQKQLGAWGELLSPALRKNTLVGLTLAVSGVIGLWGVGFFSPELIRTALKTMAPSDRGYYVGLGTMLQDVGAFFGIYFFTVLAARWGRKPAFALSFLLAFTATAVTFQFLRTPGQIYWMLPLLGFCNLGVFGGYAIYFPELYPTRVRNSGVGFCYNVGRFITAGFILVSAYLVPLLTGLGVAEPIRTGSIIIAGIYFLGIIVLWWAPETRGRPLPE
jgi:MFS family permease